MRKLAILLIIVLILGCMVKESVKTFTPDKVTEDNVVIYGSVEVQVNPNLDYLNISGNTEKNKRWDDPTKRKFNLFTRSGINKIVLIETHTRRLPNSFKPAQDSLTKNMAVIQRGSRPIAGKTWEVYTRALPEFPDSILSAVKQNGISIAPYRCGMEIGVARELDRFSRIYVRYFEGSKECQMLPQNGSILNDAQLRLLQGFVSRFDENITISDQSGG